MKEGELRPARELDGSRRKLPGTASSVVHDDVLDVVGPEGFVSESMRDGLTKLGNAVYPGEPQEAHDMVVEIDLAEIESTEVFPALGAKTAKLAQRESRLDKHDRQIVTLVQAIRQLMAPPPEPPRKRIGLQSEMEG